MALSLAWRYTRMYMADIRHNDLKFFASRIAASLLKLCIRNIVLSNQGYLPLCIGSTVCQKIIFSCLDFKLGNLIKVLHADHQPIGVDAVLATATDIILDKS